MTKVLLQPTVAYAAQRAARRRYQVEAAISMLFLVLAGVEVMAQLIDCKGLSVESPGYKILLDDLRYSGTDSEKPEDLEETMALLRFRLDGALQELRLNPDMRIRVIRCQGRMPSGEADFNPDFVQLLETRQVLLEVWGTVMSCSKEGEKKGCDALVSYIMIPVHADQPDSGLGFHEVEYQSALEDAPSRLLNLFGEAHEIRAFTALSAGLRELDNQDYDLARKYICRAEFVLRKTRKAEDPLVSFVSQMNSKILDAARNDPDYSGLLRAPQIGPCDEVNNDE